MAAGFHFSIRNAAVPLRSTINDGRSGTSFSGLMFSARTPWCFSAARLESFAQGYITKVATIGFVVNVEV